MDLTYLTLLVDCSVMQPTADPFIFFGVHQNLDSLFDLPLQTPTLRKCKCIYAPKFGAYLSALTMVLPTESDNVQDLE